MLFMYSYSGIEGPVVYHRWRGHTIPLNAAGMSGPSCPGREGGGRKSLEVREAGHLVPCPLLRYETVS